MIPQPGNIVVVIFRTGIQIEGEVISWSDNKSILKSLAGVSTIVIQKTLEDVLFFKYSNSKTDFNKLKEKHNKTQNDISELATLKNELNELEKAEIRDKLATHTIGETTPVHYGIPNIAQIKGPQQYPRTETTQQNTGISSELQYLFKKKY